MAQLKHSCIILAGGEGKRMGGADKGLVNFDQRPLITHMIAVAQQVSNDIIISANRNLEHYREYGYPVISDEDRGYHGPMAGITACLPRCRHDTSFIIPCDTPGLSSTWLTRLDQLKTREIAIIEHNARLQLVMLMDTSLHTRLVHALEHQQYALMRWVNGIDHDVVTVELDPAFTNVNTRDDLPL